MRERRPAILVLEDGMSFEGTSFGSPGEATGEVVFNTSMTGYQEILTDPSYKGQIVAMTYPLIGNYGVTHEDMESAKPHVAGFVVKEYSEVFSNWRGQTELGRFLRDHNIVAMQGVDTRALTKHIRTAGAMKAIISTDDLLRRRLLEKARAAPGLVGRDLVREVTCSSPYRWTPSANRDRLSGDLFRADKRRTNSQGSLSVVAMDFGIKESILKILHAHGCTITVVPASTSAGRILSHSPDGIFLSNGPGDPKGVPYGVKTVRKLLGQRPIFGICLGHQILGLALGGKTFKLKFGHRGGNHPVKDLKTGRITITAQNHGFCVDPDSLDRSLVDITHINLNDHTIEGMAHRSLPIYSVQYHPEASPGPHDSRYLFDGFLEAMGRGKNA
jgi:carbamoyl-phosphate synthase small subunit